MRVVDGTVRISATDLTAFIACKHLTLLELARSHGLELPERELPHQALADLARRGEEHEAEILERYRVLADGDVVSIPKEGDDEDRCQQTRGALAARRKVIYQGVLLGEGQFGAPDFLVRGDVFDPAGDPETYAVVDAKLARSAKANAVLQTTFYSRLLKDDFGSVSEWMYLELGDGVREPLRVADFAAYEAEVHRRLREYVVATPVYPIADPYPEKVEHCGICSWRKVCSARRRADDDLSLVAGASRRQRNALKSAGTPTRRALASLNPAALPATEIEHGVLLGLHRQAHMQVESEDEERLCFEFADDEASLRAQLANAESYSDPETKRREPLRGLFQLPAPDPGDVFFDLEAARFFTDSLGFGLEYLFGRVMADGGSGPGYVADWAFDRADEREVFERFITEIHARWKKHPGMHVYHYNHYEPTALDRLSDRHSTMTELLGALMGRYDTMVSETDDLIRGRVFVDLYPIFRQAIRAGIESYSLKQTERVAGYERSQLLEEADGHMLTFQRALEDGPGTARTLEATQAIIAAYNEDDCRATLALRDWLEGQRSVLEERIGVIPRPPGRVPPDEIDPDDAAEVARSLRDSTGPDAVERALLADLLEFERRENKPAWWEFFRLREIDDEGLLRAPKAIAGLEFVERVDDKDGRPVPMGQLVSWAFHFPPQDISLRPGDHVRDPREYRVAEKEDGSPEKKHGKRWEIREIDDENGVVLVGAKRGEERPRALVAEGPLPPSSPSKSLLRYAQQAVEGDLGLAARPIGAALLGRHSPNLRSGPLHPREPGVSVVDFSAHAALDLDHSYLAIQGPPGTGKTYTGAEIVIALLREDPSRKIGVTGQSHAVIANLLREIGARRDAHGLTFGIGQYADTGKAVWDGADLVTTHQEDALSQLDSGDISVLGATAWTWSRGDVEGDGGLLDTLIIDEAGQFSLAFAVAVAGSIRERLILLGDPQQLPQVTSGVHPDGVGVSVLEHVLGGEPVIPPDRGIFLGETRRMHDDITSFVSDAFYLGALEGTPGLGLDLQAVQGEAPISGSGIRLVDVEHEGNDSSSIEEATTVADAVVDLLGRTWVDRQGDEHAVEPSDILVVTPYNAQIAAIAKELRERGDGASHVRVGTVDKFQGQEAAVVIYSMATSSADEAPRGMVFLYQLNRLNVATSRAKAMAIVVMSPELVRVDCKTPRQMQFASAHCLLRERATAI